MGKLKFTLLAGLLLLSGCQAQEPSAQATSSLVRRGSGPGWVGLIEFPEVGRISWRCKGATNKARRFSTLYLARGATQQVRYTLGSGRTETRALQPGQRLSTPLRVTASTTWRVSKATEPERVTVTVDIRFDITSSGRCIVDVARAKIATLPHD